MLRQPNLPATSRKFTPIPPEFIERVELLYNDAAKAAGVYVASAMGFDSVPGDLGVQVLTGVMPACCRLYDSTVSSRGQLFADVAVL